ncbi:AraC family transcriptional regulator [Mucilaginibacter gossypiicola]|nr:AraC family transcriptional regulator [Mucilaginibacter gossypiicola]
MKVLQFTIPVPHNKSVIVERVSLPHHYPYLHRHKEIQLTWIRNGEGTLIVGNNVHDFCAGDVFLIGANLPHVFKSSSEYFERNSGRQIEALNLFFNLDETLLALFSMPEMKQALTFFQQFKPGFKVPYSILDKVTDTMIELDNSSGPDQIIQFFNLIGHFTAAKCKFNMLSTQNKLPDITENEGIRISRIYNYVMQHYHQTIGLEDVAGIACMTPGSFCRYFKKHTGHTFVEFLNEVRINEACKKLIAHKFESINNIAYKCGFLSITNFNRVFKSLMGITPKHYVDSYNNNIFNVNMKSSFRRLPDFTDVRKSRVLVS